VLSANISTRFSPPGPEWWQSPVDPGSSVTSLRLLINAKSGFKKFQKNRKITFCTKRLGESSAGITFLYTHTFEAAARSNTKTRDSRTFSQSSIALSERASFLPFLPIPASPKSAIRSSIAASDALGVNAVARTIDDPDSSRMRSTALAHRNRTDERLDPLPLLNVASTCLVEIRRNFFLRLLLDRFVKNRLNTWGNVSHTGS
jgi:hypothetical protein